MEEFEFVTIFAPINLIAIMCGYIDNLVGTKPVVN